MSSKVFASLALMAWLVCVGEVGSAAAEVILDRAAPSLVLTELNGGTFDLSQKHGKVVLVTYWATWCAPCKKEMPILDSFYRRYRERGLEIIGISADRPQDFAKMRKMSDALAYPTATLDQITDNGFGPPEGFPLTYVVDRDGVIRDKFIDVREQLLRDVVLPLLPP
ncbi:TlpA disulfide reductase family protein [Bradyrhizobium sp.]|jgi:peroxiredoxin|uniref:TlpA disulfide reductase family protein n=1 Tax=Bradyrhizobium sp. TaxID=376 RepID=UPI003D0E8BEE